MTSDDSSQAGSAPEASSARALGQWVATLAEDAVCVAEVSRQFAPGSPLRAPLRAGLRHLLHIERLARGIEALAMLEVSIMLRVTALLASPAEELDDEAVLRLRADTPLIEELFPEERSVIWAFCEALIEQERRQPSEDAPAREAPSETPSSETPSSETQAASVDAALLDQVPAEFEGVDAERLSATFEHEVAPATDPLAPNAEDAGDVGLDSADTAARVGSDDEATGTVAPPITDELVERIRAWATSYQPPTFGNKPHDLTRARAFVRTRVSAWSGA